MTAIEARIVASARACVGARFRLHGRSPETGLDCIGVAALVYGVADPPGGYALRGDRLDDLRAGIAAAGLRPAGGEARPGDLLLLRPGPFQFHLAILTDRGFVHADAGLRRVTEVPGAPLWPLAGRWRHP
ncbi:hypothetical protein [Sphingomonas sp. PR090111-T3T-6A]|uniref:hypothetical protein n=1 Tax=Sphingomonas sp. PR090111-T3T-6A TaxID=685778 RepID=UPI00036679FD|nr:hypothetical protein [Sphingomonas sp. PR090111-T3T-6A]